MLDSGQHTFAGVDPVRVHAPQVQAHVASAAGEESAFGVVDDVANGLLVEAGEGLELSRGAAGQDHFDEDVFEVVSVVDADDELGAERVHVDHEAVQQRPRELLLRLVEQLQRERLLAEAVLADLVRVAVDQVNVALDGQHGPDAPLDPADDDLDELESPVLHREELDALVAAGEEDREGARTGLAQIRETKQNFVDGRFR